MLKYIKDLLKIDNLDEDDEKALENDLQSYEEIVNSNKYADSNSNTDALEKLLSAIKVSNNQGSANRTDAPGAVVEENNPSANTDTVDTENDAQTKTMFDRRKGYRFIDLLDKHLDLLHTLENEALPAQPVYTPAKFGKEGGQNFVLKRYAIPRWIFASMKDNDVGRLNIKDPLTASNYVKRFQTLLWIEEAQQDIEMRRYDMPNVLLAKYDDAFFQITVPVPGGPNIT